MPEHDLVLKSKLLFYLGESQLDPSRARAAGLYARDTRHLNNISAELDGAGLEVLATTVHHATAATITSTNPSLMLNDQSLLLSHQVSIEQRVSLDAGLHIAYVMQNYSRRVIDLAFGLHFSADFRDLFEIRGFHRDFRGTLLRPHAHPRALSLRYRSVDQLVAGTLITFDRDPQIAIRRQTMDGHEMLVSLLPGHDEARLEPAPDDLAGVLARFPVSLQPEDRWELRISIKPEYDDGLDVSITPVVPGQAVSDRATITTDNPCFNRLLSRSQDDLIALITRFPHGDLPAGGIPWYVAPFGRDSLIASLQTMHLSPGDAEGTLRVLAALQGKKIDDWTEEEPGKILHEMRYGEMARTGETPHRPYFGSIDATSLFVLLFAETVAWTGNDDLYFDLSPAVKMALTWIETYGDLNGDGMIEYRSDQDSTARIRHQVWKDSQDSLNHLDGRPARGNITPVEVQGYTYGAYRRLADVASMFGDEPFAADLRAKAAVLAERVNHDFWMESEQFYAQALDGDKQPVRSISSNPGQLLFTGIVPPDRGQAVVRRLQHPDMESGWGIRTLSSAAASYNPMSYHNGSVWPHDNSLIAAGYYLYGAFEEANAIFESLYDAASRGPDNRLSELYCGFGRSGNTTDGPVPYPGACSPQAWAAGSFPYLIRSSLGLVADINAGVLRVSPRLPDFLNEVTIHHMPVLGRNGSLTVRRKGPGYQVESTDLPIEAVETAASLAN